MNKVLAIYKKEMKSFFASPIAYIVIAMFLVISGYFFSMVLFGVQEANVTLRFIVGNMSIILLFMVPGLTMRLLTEEKKVGTIELLMTSPISHIDLVLGKYLGCLCLFVIMLGLTLVFPIILAIVSEIDIGSFFSNYLGLLLLGGAFISIGLFASSFTENQIISFILSFGLLLIFWLIGWVESIAGPVIGKIFSQLSVLSHFDSFARGIIDLTDIFYYLGIIFIFLFLTVRIIEAKQWQ